MKVTVVGAGAMGSLFGGCLALAGEDVCLVDVWEEHVKAINSTGLRIYTGDNEKLVPVKAVTKPAAMKSDLVIIFVKSTFTEQAARNCLPLIGDDTVVLTLQNGIGNVEKLARILGEHRVIAGTTSQGATVLGPGIIRHAGAGETNIGELTGAHSERIAAVAAAFNRAGLTTNVTDNVMGLIWSKLIINVGINALTAITSTTNGQLLEHPELVELLTLAVNEATKVTARKNIQLIYDDPVEKVKAVAKATATNKSSMRQDIERGKKTEIEVINGAIVDEAQKLGIEVPVNKALTLLVKTIEKQ